jgi:4-diphosphocytidyl-2-C-methyl-D-erythritol kinase
LVTNDKDNFIYKAALLLKQIKENRDLGAKIILKKNIPIKVGLGGGSTDAAAALHGLGELWGISLKDSQTREIAKKLGKDFYYSLYGGLAEVLGKGKNFDVIRISSKLPKFWLLIVIPHEEKPSTGWMYEKLNTKDIGRNLNKFESLKDAILQKNKKEIFKNLHNDFENSVISFYPVVRNIKNDLLKVGASAALMAGSGLSVVGFFESKAKVQKARGKLKGKYQKVLIAKTIN